ncbi:membrane hypothetical protein [Luteimonas sp. 9C]|uniref:hypothetical protein n=1 Tax=Luteimonas sp. 9C TaxID=2653148 RepID=UPI0012F02FAE|nr:hypothetical protein [Luteimonas sp. 9C]VXC05848.1 membrane hypothetical protein [Luteimonas sp. 9C]
MDVERLLLAVVTAFATWVMFALPLLIAFAFLAFRYRRADFLPWVRPLTGALLGLLVAPMPPPGMLPIIPPNVLSVLLEGPDYPSNSVWAAASLAISVLLFAWLGWRLRVPPNNSFKPMPLRGTA